VSKTLWPILLIALLSPCDALASHDETYVSPIKGVGNFIGQTDRTLRYRPDGTDFVIENGGEFFNRPLYGRTHTPFRIDGGDEPEFSLYLPERWRRADCRRGRPHSKPLISPMNSRMVMWIPPIAYRAAVIPVARFCWAFDILSERNKE
jgi:hypothetical protein